MIPEAIGIPIIAVIIAVGLTIMLAPTWCEVRIANAIMSYKDWRGKAERERLRIR